MKLLLVLPGLMESGATRVNLELAREWEATGRPTTVFVPQPETSRQVAPTTGLSIEYGSEGRGRLTRGRFRYAWPRILARLVASARRADIVVSGSEIGNGLLLGWLAARLTRRPFVVIVHASPRYMAEHWSPRGVRGLTIRTVGRCDAAVCVSPDLQEEVAALGVPADRVTYIPNGRDVDGLRARARALENERAGQSDVPLVVGVGRLVSQKGFDLLLRACASVLSQGLEHRLRIIGEGPDRTALEGLARELGIEDAVEMPGFSSDVPADIASASLFCLPSRHEGQPLVLIEAMALGLPVVAASCSSGVRALVGDGRYGKLVPVESVDELAESVANHLRDPTELRSRLAAGSAHVQSFSMQATAKRYLDVLSAVGRDESPNGAATPTGPIR